MQSMLSIFGVVVYAATFLLLAAVNFVNGGKIDNKKVPMQWNFKGDPTWYADKQIGLWFPVLIFLLVGGSLLYKARSSAPHFWPDYGVLLFLCVFVVGVHYWHISKVIAWSQKQL
ncbi:hypothetical protein [Methylobacterium sp. J-068]|uniref:hypothetical protein n=1 Tax=Methylobacterium sp. J-068 TaxID=2836649 RepID=UPI001FBA752D|nr:hypothetical protein [Methylobacterium sp. J-068]MCJ2035647.1 hypothetical protein [Methylobacterium sp. J-068]